VDVMNKFRGFIAVDVGPFPKIIEFENQIKDTDADVKLVDPKNVHITLKFLGDTDENLVDRIEEIMKKSVEKIKPFEIKLKGAGVFPNKNYIKVMWIGINDTENLKKISNGIDEQLSKIGFEKEKRDFSAHLTLARVKTPKNKDKLLQIVEKYRETDFTKIKIDSIRLKQSELTPKGPIYTTVREVRL
jgi:2'-5' RNA ligase